MPGQQQLSLCVSCGYTGPRPSKMRRSDFMDSHSRHLRTMPRRRAPLASASPEAALRDNLFFCDGEGEAHLPLLTAGVDEAGRGPLAGPVCAAAVILDPENPIEGLADSKKLSAKKREALAPIIRERALAWGHRLGHGGRDRPREYSQCHLSRHGACCGGTEEPQRERDA